MSDIKLKIPVLEIFGPTIQGEGMVIGQKTVFVRTAGCDYKCAWCDSKFTWDGSQKPQMMSPEDVLYTIRDLAKGGNVNHVTISGGNPALIGLPMGALITLLHAQGMKVGLETQGSRWQQWMVDIDDLTISPKPPSSGMITDWATLDYTVNQLFNYGSNFSLKIVVFNEIDLKYAKQVFARYAHLSIPKFLSVGNLDVKSDDPELASKLLQSLGWLFDKVIADPDLNDVRPLPQLHTLVWGNARGV